MIMKEKYSSILLIIWGIIGVIVGNELSFGCPQLCASTCEFHTIGILFSLSGIFFMLIGLLLQLFRLKMQIKERG